MGRKRSQLGRTSAWALVVWGLLACTPPPAEGVLAVDLATPPAPIDPATLRLVAGDLPPGQDGLVWGFAPSAAGVSVEGMKPIAQYLSMVLGVPVELRVFDDYDSVFAEVPRGSLDLVLLSPLSYVHAKERVPDLNLLAQEMRGGTITYSSYIIVPAWSSARTLEDLRGKRVALVHEQSTSGFLLPYAAFLRAGIDPETDFEEFGFSGGHLAGIDRVSLGEVDAVASYSGRIAEARARARSEGKPEPRVRILQSVGRIPHNAICAGPGLSTRAAEKLASALVSLNTQSTMGAAILAPSGELTGYLPAEDELYDRIRVMLDEVTANRAAQAQAPGETTSG